ncbi:MAG: DUF5362 domain-containing protein [Bacteroidetes bacterium]|nr:DUF5362 domain-containing protein [Bacteroidota bacterium]
MEQNEPIDSGLGYEDLGLTQMAKNYLHETAKWARLLSIVGFVFIGLIVIMALFAGAFLSSTMQEMQQSGIPFGGTFITIIYLAVAALYFFPTLYLYRFATRTKLAIETQDTDQLTSGLENLKSTFKFMGILMIVVLSIYALGIIIALFGAMTAL